MKENTVWRIIFNYKLLDERNAHWARFVNIYSSKLHKLDDNILGGSAFCKNVKKAV